MDDQAKTGIREGASVGIIDKRSDEGILVIDAQNRGLDFLSALNKLAQVPGVMQAKDKVKEALALAVKGFIACALVFLAGCASYLDLGNGRYIVTESSQEPVAIGVSNSYSLAKNCKGTQAEGYHYEKLTFSDCHWDLANLKHGTAPGWFPQIFQGLATMAGFGILGATMPASGGASASSSSSSISNAVVTAPMKGGHH